MASLVQLKVDDTSPTIAYFPFGDTLSTPNLTAGWNPYFNISGFDTFPGQIGQGTSMHITSLNGASLSISWQGTGIQLLGNTTRASFSVEVDGVSIDPQVLAQPNDVLITISNLANTNHTLSLTANISDGLTDPPQSMLVFDAAVLTAPPPPNTTENSFTLQALRDSNVSFFGQWSFQTDQNNQSFHKSNTAGDTAHSLFLGTTFLIRGRTSPDAGNYSVQLDGLTRQFSAKSSFAQNDSLLFFATGLDPTVIHNWQITNDDGSTLILPIGGFSAFADGDPNPTSSAVSTPVVTGITYTKGTIAALALAGVLAFILLSGFLFFLLVYRPHRRRMRQERHERRERRRKAQEAGLVLDIGPDTLGQAAIPDSRRTSRRTGFARWKHEVEGGALGLSDIGISFRRSEEKEEFEDLEMEEDAPQRARSFRFTPSPKLKGKSRWIGGRGNHNKERSSPSIMLDLPPIHPHPRSRSDSRSGGQDASSGLTSLSYLSTPSNNSVAPLASFSGPRSPSASPALHTHPVQLQFTPPEESNLRSGQESDFGSVREYDDGTSILGPKTAQAAIRGLSPRTSEAGSRSGSQASQHYALGVPRWQSPSPQQGRRSPPRERDNKKDETGNFLDVRTSTPFSVDLPSGTRSRQLSTLSHVRFEDVGDKGRSQDELKAPQVSSFRLTPTVVPTPHLEGARSRVTSFLDFGAGSSDNSIIGGHSTQSSNGSFTNQPKSRWSNTTVPSQEGPKPDSSGDSQSQSQSFVSIANSSPSSFPFPVSLPASPHHPEGHRPSPPSASHILPGPTIAPNPPGSAVNLESPTESVPISITDLHFRHSDSEDSDPSHLPRHPPLPNLESTSTPEEDDDIATPTFVVARVLGMATPSAVSFTHTRLGTRTSHSQLTRRPSEPS